MQNIHNLKVDISIVNEPCKAPKHYRLRLLMENNKKTVCNLKTTTDSPADLFNIFQTAGLAAALEMERRTGREFKKPLVVHLILSSLYIRLAWIKFKSMFHK
jgi:hypothetical protein